MLLRCFLSHIHTGKSRALSHSSLVAIITLLVSPHTSCTSCVTAIVGKGAFVDLESTDSNNSAFAPVPNILRKRANVSDTVVDSHNKRPKPEPGPKQLVLHQEPVWDISVGGDGRPSQQLLPPAAADQWGFVFVIPSFSHHHQTPTETSVSQSS